MRFASRLQGLFLANRCSEPGSSSGETASLGGEPLQKRLKASSLSFPAVNREQFYVSISRGRERCSIFTDDARLLRDRIGRSRQRKAALELQQLKEALLKGGFTPQQPQPAPAAADLQRTDPRAVRSHGNGSPVRSVRPARATRSTRPTPNLQRSLPARVSELFLSWTRSIRDALGIRSTAPGQPRPDTLQPVQERPAHIAAGDVSVGGHGISL